MSWFKEAITPLPKEAAVPTVEPVNNGRAISEYAPKQYRVIDEGQQNIFEKAANILNNHIQEKASLQEQLEQALIQLEIMKGRIGDLDLAVSQANNRANEATNVRDEALRETLFLRGKLSSVRAIVDDDEIPMPRKRNREAKGAKNGEPAVQAQAAETPPGEAAKAEGDHGQTSS